MLLYIRPYHRDWRSSVAEEILFSRSRSIIATLVKPTGLTVFYFIFTKSVIFREPFIVYLSMCLKNSKLVTNESIKDFSGKAGADVKGCLECALREASHHISDAMNTKLIIVTAASDDNQNGVKRSLISLSKRSEVYTIMVGSQRYNCYMKKSDSCLLYTSDAADE